MNVKDMLFKAFWTLVNFVLAAVAVYITDAEPPFVWGAGALTVIQFVSTWVRQKLGATPPEAPAVGPLAH